MTVDLKPQEGGRMHFSLGPVERWVVGICAAGIVAAGYWFMSSVNARLDRQNETLQVVVTGQAVQSGQIQTLTTQLADVPRLTREMAEIKVRVDRHEQDIRDLSRNRRTQ